MTSRRKKTTASNGILVKGFCRAALRNVHTGEEEISPWYENAITSTGFQAILLQLAASTNSSELGGIACGHMTNANSGQASYLSTNSNFDSSRRGIASCAPGSSSYGTLSASASWESNLATGTINAFGMVHVTTGTPPLFSIAAVASSDKASNQTLSVTYQWRFASA